MTFNNDTAAWRRVRLSILDRDDHLCQVRLPGCLVDADEVDHIIPTRAGGSWYDPDNLRASCGPCNRRRARHDKVPSRASREW